MREECKLWREGGDESRRYVVRFWSEGEGEG